MFDHNHIIKCYSRSNPVSRAYTTNLFCQFAFEENVIAPWIMMMWMFLLEEEVVFFFHLCTEVDGSYTGYALHLVWTCTSVKGGLETVLYKCLRYSILVIHLTAIIHHFIGITCRVLFCCCLRFCCFCCELQDVMVLSHTGNYSCNCFPWSWRMHSSAA